MLSPKIMGLMNNQYSSIRLYSIREWAAEGLPNMMIFSPGLFFNFSISAGILSLIKVVLFFSESFMVRDKTTLSTLLYHVECCISCLEALGLSPAVGQ